jgi:hypothetical protein
MPDRGDESQYFDASDGHRIVAHLRDGRVMALGRYSEVVTSGNHNVIVRVPDLKYVETVIQVEFYTNPDTDADWWGDKKITGNLVGLTVYGVTAGTTLTTEIVAIGPP